MIELVFFVVGVITGALLVVERRERAIRKTFEQVDAEVRAELKKSQNLISALKEDVTYLRKKLHLLRNQNSEQ